LIKYKNAVNVELFFHTAAQDHCSCQTNHIKEKGMLCLYQVREQLTCYLSISCSGFMMLPGICLYHYLLILPGI
ncbi:hypothetical protein VIGAN_01224500, partial [Vigna angularis var. angularis]